MDVQTHEENMENLWGLACKIRAQKRPAYTVGSEDALKNFKSVGADVEEPPEKVAWIYFRKHLDAIRDYVIHPERRGLDPEPIDTRFADAMNYLGLIYCLLQEQTPSE